MLLEMMAARENKTMPNELHSHQDKMRLLHSRSRILKSHLINLTGVSILIMFQPTLCHVQQQFFLFYLDIKRKTTGF